MLQTSPSVIQFITAICAFRKETCRLVTTPFIYLYYPYSSGNRVYKTRLGLSKHIDVNILLIVKGKANFMTHIDTWNGIARTWCTPDFLMLLSLPSVHRWNYWGVATEFSTKLTIESSDLLPRVRATSIWSTMCAVIGLFIKIIFPSFPFYFHFQQKYFPTEQMLSTCGIISFSGLIKISGRI